MQVHEASERWIRESKAYKDKLNDWFDTIQMDGRRPTEPIPEDTSMPSDFQQVLDYINGRQPVFLQTVKGVPRQQMEAWQNRYSVNLPSIYMDFMTAMGHNSGAYRPLGEYNHNFEELARKVAWLYSDDCPYGKHYPQDRYFLIGYEDEDMISPYELFLDLDSCDGNDALLVEMGSNGVYDADGRLNTGKTLGELLMKSAVLNFGNDRAGYKQKK